jgi:competence CoiA-like predicted nuclease
MLSCKIGETIINTFEYKEEKLREWSNKGMLRCPACNERMVYCHGDFKIPYFRHEKDSDCPDIYSERVTEEHLKGTRAIYEWLKTQEGISKLELEKWIPETRQRPDVYFEKDNKKYAIEYQCSPISTKYNDRRDLYKLGGIKDIWILGVKNYNMNLTLGNVDVSNYEIDDMKTKTIEREINNSDNPIIYLCETGKLIKVIDKLKPKYKYKTKFGLSVDTSDLLSCNVVDIFKTNKLQSENIIEIEKLCEILQQEVNRMNKELYTARYFVNKRIIDNELCLELYRSCRGEIYHSSISNFNERALMQTVEEEIKKSKDEIERNKREYEKNRFKNEKCEELNKRFSIVNKNCKFMIGCGNPSFYMWKVIFTSKEFDRIFFIKETQTDCTEKRGYYRNLDTYEYKKLDEKKIFEYISNNISNTLRRYKYKGLSDTTATSNINEITIGIKVKHEKFGVGTVVSISESGNDKKLTIAFNKQGVKVLLLSLVKLEVL